MTTIAWWVFWGSVMGIVYAYAGYPLLLAVTARFVRREIRVQKAEDEALPSVALIVPVHNERTIIGRKLENTAALEYPDGRLEVLFVSDGSTDGTTEAIVGCGDPRVRLIELNQRGGKASGLNAGLAIATAPIVVFSDASIMLDAQAIREIVAPFQHAEVGCVSGEDRIAEGGGEGLYGRYELGLRRLESRVSSIVGASGSFYAQRRELCGVFVPNVAPDFLSALRTVAAGYRAITWPSAMGQMSAVREPRAEFQRKVRTILRGITTLVQYRELMNPFRTGFFAVELASHKLARWLVPFWLVTMLLANAVLVPTSSLYAALFAAQIVFYLLALAPLAGFPAGSGTLPVRVASYFTSVNAATLVAWIKYLAGTRQELWSPSRRVS